MKGSLAIRISGDNPNHHLWNNHGVWFLHYTIHPDALTKQRIRGSLQTRSLRVARRKRDQLLAEAGTTIAGGGLSPSGTPGGSSARQPGQ